MFRPGLAQKPQLWLGLSWLWLSQKLGRAKAATHGLALARLGLSRGFLHRKHFFFALAEKAKTSYEQIVLKINYKKGTAVLSFIRVSSYNSGAIQRCIHEM